MIHYLHLKKALLMSFTTLAMLGAKAQTNFAAEAERMNLESMVIAPIHSR